MMGDFRLSGDLAEGEIRNIQWNDTGDSVTKNAHIMGLHPDIRNSLLDYCDHMGITQIMQELTIGSRGCEYEDDELLQVHTDIRLQGFDWYIQSADKWPSDMHWMSPTDAVAEANFLEAFSNAGFDRVLQSVGAHFGYQGLVAYHLSIIAVSQCLPGTIHVDCTKTGSRAMNVIIPLILADKTGPELNLQDEKSQKVGKYRYQYDVAALVGDDAHHGTGAVDYQGEMRMAATIFIADIGADNIEAVMSDFVTYPQAYPPPGQPDILLQSARKHWDRNNPSKKLPIASVLPVIAATLLS